MAEDLNPDNLEGGDSRKPEAENAAGDSGAQDPRPLGNGGLRLFEDLGTAGMLDLRNSRPNRKARRAQNQKPQTDSWQIEPPEAVEANPENEEVETQIQGDPEALDTTDFSARMDTLPDGGGWIELAEDDRRRTRRSKDRQMEEWYRGLGRDIAGGVESGSEQATSEFADFTRESLEQAARAAKNSYETVAHGARKSAEGLAKASRWFGDIFKEIGKASREQAEMERELGHEVTSGIYSELQDIYAAHYMPESWDKWSWSLRKDYEKGLRRALMNDYRKAVRDSYEMKVRGNIRDDQTGIELGRGAAAKQVELLRDRQRLENSIRTNKLGEVLYELDEIASELDELKARATAAGSQEKLQRVARLEQWIDDIRSEPDAPETIGQKMRELTELRDRKMELEQKLAAVEPSLHPREDQLINPVGLEEAGRGLVESGLVDQEDLEAMVDQLRVIAQDLKVGDNDFGRRLDEISHAYLVEDDRAIRRVRDLIRRSPDILRKRNLDVMGSRLDRSVYIALVDYLWDSGLAGFDVRETVSGWEDDLKSTNDQISRTETFLEALRNRDSDRIISDLTRELDRMRLGLNEKAYLEEGLELLDGAKARVRELRAKRTDLRLQKAELEKPFEINIAGAFAENPDLVDWNGHLRELRAKLVYRQQLFDEQDAILKSGDQEMLAILKTQVPKDLADLEKAWQWKGWKAGSEQAALVWRPLLNIFQRDLVRKHDYLRQVHSYKKWIEGLEAKPVNASKRLQALKLSADRLGKIQENRDAWMSGAGDYWENQLREIFEHPGFGADSKAVFDAWNIHRKSLPTVWAHIEDLAMDPSQELAKNVAMRFKSYQEDYERLSGQLEESLELELDRNLATLSLREDLQQRAKLAESMLSAVAMFNYERLRSVGMPQNEAEGLTAQVRRWLRMDSASLWDAMTSVTQNPLIIATGAALMMYGGAELANWMENGDFIKSTKAIGSAPAHRLEVTEPRAPKAVENSINFPNGFERFGELGVQYMENFRELERLGNDYSKMRPVILENLSILRKIRPQAEGSQNLNDLILVDQQVELNETWLKIIDLSDDRAA